MSDDSLLDYDAELTPEDIAHIDDLIARYGDDPDIDDALELSRQVDTDRALELWADEPPHDDADIAEQDEP